MKTSKAIIDREVREIVNLVEYFIIYVSVRLTLCSFLFWYWELNPAVLYH